MVRFMFSDGQDICSFDGEKVTKSQSKFIESYKSNAESIARSKQWKTTGEGARFRETVATSDSSDLSYDVRISGVFPTESLNQIIYTFSVNQTSGIYKKDLSDEKSPETHVINSIDYTFNGGFYNCSDGRLATSVQRGYYNADIAIMDVSTGDYKTVTDGDTMDEDPYISPDDSNIIYFSSRGVGRDGSGNFVCFSPSAIYRLDLNSVSVEEVACSSAYSYFKPAYYGGKLYAIKAPAKQKRGNPIIEIILIPWRILQGIAGFINMFVKAFSGKSITSDGDNPTKGRDIDSRKVEIYGNLIDVEKEKKKNAGKKDNDFGYVPNSWQLVEVESGKVIKSGVADYDIAEDGTFVITNGRRIFTVKDGECKKVANAEFCLRVNCRHAVNSSSDFFDL
ncbi:MAG: TolB family protein [Candidatus Coproplasma sp.]